VIWDAPGEPRNRHAIYATGIDDLFLGGFAGSPAGWGMAAIGLDAVRRAFISESRVDPGTSAFVGLRNTPAREVILSGNDLADTSPTAPGLTYIHIPRDTEPRP
jgi:hypothetical protein